MTWQELGEYINGMLPHERNRDAIVRVSWSVEDHVLEIAQQDILTALYSPALEREFEKNYHHKEDKPNSGKEVFHVFLVYVNSVMIHIEIASTLEEIFDTAKKIIGIYSNSKLEAENSFRILKEHINEKYANSNISSIDGHFGICYYFLGRKEV